MIPRFPEFKKLELADKEDVEKITKQFPPYSDFNFVSMWSWDTRGEMRISLLNDNLVVRFTDYVTNKPFYSFLGNTKTNETTKELIDFSVSQGLSGRLKLIPEVAVQDLDATHFIFSEDRDDFDYIYSVESLMQLQGPDHANSRRLTNKFSQNADIHISDLDLSSVKDSMQVLNLNARWKASKGFDFESENEDKALVRMLYTARHLSLIDVGVFIQDELVAFTLNERVHQEYSTSYFAKFDVKYKGAYLYSMKITAERLLKEGCKYINCEQDLGLPGLRVSKEALCPSFFLKKYTVKLK